MIILTIFQSDWREPQICQCLSLKSDYFDNFPIWVEGTTSGEPYNEELLPGELSKNRNALPGAPHEQKCFTWDSPTNRNALPGTPPRTEMLYLGRPHEQKCFSWDSPQTEMLYLERPHEQKCFTREKNIQKLSVKYKHGLTNIKTQRKIWKGVWS